MSQRGRGSGPHDDDPDSEDAGGDDASDSSLFAAPRPITPYDPYRSSSGDTVRRPTRNVAAESFDAPGRPSSRYSQNDPFLPDDDPLNAEAWQLDLDEAEIVDVELDAPRPDVEREPAAPRRPRRPPSASASSTRGRAAETGSGVRRTARRGGAASASVSERLPRASVSIGVPQAITSSSLAADPTALLLLGINLISLLLMALILGVRLGGLPSPTVLHLDAAGNPDRWGPPNVLWRLPLMAFFINLMFGVVAWFLHPIDRFAARFALGAAIVAQLVAWIAVIQHLFMA